MGLLTFISTNPLNPDLARAAAANSHHIHGRSRTVGRSGAGGHVDSITPYSVVASDVLNTFGAESLLFDGNEGDFDLPFTINSYDPSEIFVTDVGTNTNIWEIQFVFSQVRNGTDYVTFADALAAKNYSTIAFKIDSPNSDGTPLMILTPRLQRGSKLWGRVKRNAAGGSAAARTISFLFTHFHGYPGLL